MQDIRDLIICYGKPQKPVPSETVSRWIKKKYTTSLHWGGYGIYSPPNPLFLVVFIGFYISRYHFSQIFRTFFPYYH